jgi:iron(III) transport system permease protein
MFTTNPKHIIRNIIAVTAAGAMAFSVAACGSANANGTGSDDQVVIYTNADDEAVTAFKNALDGSGYADKYVVQSFGTSELGGKLLAEGKNIEADLITMSSYYVDSAQEKNSMFADLSDVTSKPLDSAIPAYRDPTTSQEGCIFYNTEALKAAGLDVPTSIKDLAKPEYKDQISFPDMGGSSTGWLMVQAIISAYGEDEGKQILTDIFKNAGPHAEQSGSAPLKAVRAGEVSVGFGLRHQAVADKAQGLPIDFVDPTEGNFSLTESVAVIDKGDKTKTDVQKMAAAIIDKGRAELIKTYPNPLYEGESEPENHSKYPKTFDKALSVDLLQQHQDFSDSCKQTAQE